MKKVDPDCHFYDNESKGYMWAWSEWGKDQAVEAAVLAERKRVWDVLETAKEYEIDWPEDYAAIVRVQEILFPSGEPTAEKSSVDQTNPPQQAWKEYANRLRRHWCCAAIKHPCYRDALKNNRWDEYERAVSKWYDDHYLTEPMAPGQEYANNH